MFYFYFFRYITGTSGINIILAFEGNEGIKEPVIGYNTFYEMGDEERSPFPILEKDSRLITLTEVYKVPDRKQSIPDSFSIYSKTWSRHIPKATIHSS